MGGGDSAQAACGQAGWPDGLSPMEQAMIEAARTGEVTEPLPDAADPGVRARVLRELLVGTTWEVAAGGVRLRGMRITGQLDLSGATVRCPLRLEDCSFDGPEPVNLDFADLPLLSATGCTLPGLSGKTLKVNKDLILARSTFIGPVRLNCADIAGDLDCTSARLDGAGDALAAATITVGGNLYLSAVITTAGGIDLEGADITGTLKCSGAQLNGPVRRYGTTYSLFAQWIKVGGPVRLNNEKPAGRFTAAHLVGLLGASISANLNCRGAVFNGQEVMNGGPVALLGERMKVGGNVLADHAAARFGVRSMGMSVA